MSRKGRRKRERSESTPATPAPPRRNAWLLATTALAVATVALVALRSRPAATPAAAPRTRDNLLLITLDTTRADHLGAYGDAKARTRHLDQQFHHR